MRKIFYYSHIFLSVMAMCATLASCSSDEEIINGSEGDSSELSCVAKDKELVGEYSRSSLSFSWDKGMVFKWSAEDWMTVFAKGDFNATQLYKLISGGESPTARFSAENFRLKPKQMYFSFSKTESSNTHVRIPSQNNISVDYSGQTQVANASPEHLGAYDFMAAAALCKDENFVYFDFAHLGATLRIIMSFDTNGITGNELDALNAKDEGAVKFTEMEMFNSDNSFRQPTRYFSFAAGTNGDSYSFKWPEQEINSMDRFKLNLNSISRYAAYADGSGENPDGKLVAYIEIPPMNFIDKQLGIMLKGSYKKDGIDYPVSYVGTYDKNLNVVNGKAYMLNFTMKKPDDFNVTLKVNHMWQHGNTLDSRGTGDPGNDDKIFTPNYIYYIYCHDGKVIKPQTEGATVTEISGLTDSNWETKNNNGVWISTYKGKGSTDNGIIKLQKPTCSAVGHNCSYHLYVVASNSALTLSGISENVSEEDVVRELKYNLPNDDVQTFMRDLYSTPWDATNFVGNITDPMQDVTLYHVAAKVDLKWNSTSAIESVSVNNVKNSGLYIFKPTENAYATGSYTETQTMDVDQQYSGRYVFYLPQFTNNCTYKVKLGNKAADITFTPATTGGFTSWLRWLKKY